MDKISPDDLPLYLRLDAGRTIVNGDNAAKKAWHERRRQAEAEGRDFDEEHPGYVLLTEDAREARDELVKRHMRLAFFLAPRIKHGKPWDRLSDDEREDRVQAARIGLITAIERWNPERGKLSTTAAVWVRNSIQRRCFVDRVRQVSLDDEKGLVHEIVAAPEKEEDESENPLALKMLAALEAMDARGGHDARQAAILRGYYHLPGNSLKLPWFGSKVINSARKRLEAEMALSARYTTADPLGLFD